MRKLLLDSSWVHLESESTLCGFSSTQELQDAHRQWVSSAFAEDRAVRQAQWSEAIAVGSERFTQGVKERLGISATHREVVRAEDSYALREPLAPYAGDFTGEMVPPSSENRPFWNTNVEVSDA